MWPGKCPLRPPPVIPEISAHGQPVSTCVQHSPVPSPIKSWQLRVGRGVMVSLGSQTGGSGTALFQQVRGQKGQPKVVLSLSRAPFPSPVQVTACLLPCFLPFFICMHVHAHACKCACVPGRQSAGVDFFSFHPVDFEDQGQVVKFSKLGSKHLTPEPSCQPSSCTFQERYK